MTEILVSAFLMGLLGTGHCMAMCGGISLALGVSDNNKWYGNLTYQIGRISMYGLIGLLIGIASSYLPREFAIQLRILSAIFLVIVAFYVAGWSSLATKFESLGIPIWRFISPLTKKIGRPTTIKHFLIAGMLWGWLPCGLVYSTLAIAALQGEAIQSASVMIVFGLGTLPGMLVVGMAGTQLKSAMNQFWVRQAGAIILIGMALWMVINVIGMNHHG